MSADKKTLIETNAGKETFDERISGDLAANVKRKTNSCKLARPIGPHQM
jgi:hypothetical protein